MSISQIVNVSALAFNMAGTYILFHWGFPQPNFEEGASPSLADSTKLSNGLTVSEHNQKIGEDKERFKRISQLGLALLFIGFFLQLVATFL